MQDALAGVYGACAGSRLSALNTQEAGPGLLDTAQGWPRAPSALPATSPKLEGQAKWVAAFHSDRCLHAWVHPGSLSQRSEKHGTWDCRPLVPEGESCTSHTSITWKLVRDAESEAPPGQSC